MATTYQQADVDVVELVKEVLSEYHEPLKECGLRVGVLMASNPDGPAVKVAGAEVPGTVKVVSLKDRVTKGYDVEFIVSQGLWEDSLSPEQRISLVDTLLSRVQRVPNTPKAMAAGELAWKTDDLGRPKVKLVKGDIAATEGFSSCIQRHGANSIDYVSIANASLMANAAKNSAHKDDDESQEEAA